MAARGALYQPSRLISGINRLRDGVFPAAIPVDKPQRPRLIRHDASAFPAMHAFRNKQARTAPFHISSSPA